MPNTPVATLDDLYPGDCIFLRLIRAEYADWNWYLEDGYIRYSLGASVWTYEHRLVADLAYGIPERYHVHHISETTTDNRADNLAVLSPSAHSKLHARDRLAQAVIARYGYLPEDFGEFVEASCAHCGATFERRASLVRRVEASYCSVECRQIGNRKVERPERGELRQLLIDVGNWSALGAMFGVSDNAVRKWAKGYGLDLSDCDGRRR